MPKENPPLDQEPGDILHTIARAGLSAIPVVGGPAVELFNFLISPPLEKRRDQWMKEVGETLQELEQKYHLVIEDLRSNEIFIDTVLSASQIALRSSKGEKRQALKNAILNAALPSAPEDSLQETFLLYIDIFTTWHIRMLLLFREPKILNEGNNADYLEYRIPTLDQLLESKFPELVGLKDLYEAIWGDLHQRGLLMPENVTSQKGQVTTRRTSELGNRFLDFIKKPAYPNAKDRPTPIPPNNKPATGGRRRTKNGDVIGKKPHRSRRR